ncbi:MAG: HEAT repeat domain-containing protein [Nannocystaceae bacterium]|nr:HEAT repeat domain-containing protein [Deltaproteobacteria bacterium]MBP7289555.1 HEAT repeat domain-containing protein [Nannocystaceae bacterium]
MTKIRLAFSLCALFVACDRESAPSDAGKSVASAGEAERVSVGPDAGGYGVPFGPLELEVAADAKAAAAQMIARAQDDALTDDDRVDGSADALAWVAATAPTPKLAGDALIGVAMSKAPTAAGAKVLAARMRTADPEVLDAIISAMSEFMGQPVFVNDKLLMEALADAARSHPNQAVKDHALASLWRLPVGRPERELSLAALDPAGPPSRLWRVLDTMVADDEADPLRARILTAVQGLSSHAEPAVRGAAARAWAKLVGADPTARDRLLELLADGNAYVRCEAVSGLGSMRRFYKELGPKLVKVLDDPALCEASLDVPDVGGGTKSEELSAQGSQLAVAGARAIESMSLDRPDRLTLGSMMTDEELARAAADAKAWVARQAG